MYLHIWQRDNTTAYNIAKNDVTWTYGVACNRFYVRDDLKLNPRLNKSPAKIKFVRDAERMKQFQLKSWTMLCLVAQTYASGPLMGKIMNRFGPWPFLDPIHFPATILLLPAFPLLNVWRGYYLKIFPPKFSMYIYGPSQDVSMAVLHTAP
jgi:hypothetical protein